MKRWDVWVIAAALVLCGVSALLLNSQKTDAAALKADVYVSGALVQTLPLSEPQQIWIEDRVLLRVETDGVSVLEADCPSQDCVHTGKITDSGAVIACLPNRIVIRLTGGRQDGEVDAVAR